MLYPEISIDNYKILCSDSYKILSYNTLSVFPRKVETIFFEISLLNSKPITVGTIYCSPKSK